MKLKLKRRMSGKKIRKDKRKKELESQGHRPDYSYKKNKVKGQKRRDTPNLLTDDKPVSVVLRDLRVPAKARKSAWKRFKKNFPNVKVIKGNPVYVQNKPKTSS